MLNKASQQYLSELKSAQQKVAAASLLDETHSDESSHDVISQNSELKIELGPFKMNLTRSRTVTSTNRSQKDATQSLNKDSLLTTSKEQHSGMNQSVTGPIQKQTQAVGRRVNLTL